VLPRLGARTVTAWTPADSAAVIAAVRRAGGSDALVQDVGAVMRALVTHARRLRWLTVQSEDPMWMVRYAKTASIQGATSVYVPRSSLPTDEQCAALFDALEALGHRRWAIAMRLCHRAGLRWRELVALQAQDIEFEPPGSCTCAGPSNNRPAGRPGSRHPRTARSARRSSPRASPTTSARSSIGPPPAKDQRLCCSRARRVGSCGAALPAGLDPGR
jgi:hypothetical protein